MEGEEAGTLVYVEKNGQTNLVTKRLSNMAIGLWRDDSVIELTKLKGNFFKVSGFSLENKNYLYPEEALYLSEKTQLVIFRENQLLNFVELYDLVLECIPYVCYLVYIKIKGLEYVCRRHSDMLRSFSDDRDVYDALVQNPDCTLLDTMVAYRVYPQGNSFSKRWAKEHNPSAYVIILTGENLFSARVMLQLLFEAKGVPIMIAIVFPSGNVLLEEFTDAVTSIDWKVPLAAKANSESTDSPSSLERTELASAADEVVTGSERVESDKPCNRS